MADKNKISDVLTQAQVDAQALYASAASVSPYQAANILKNAQGNIMSPGVLQSLSALGVDGKSGVAASIANIDAQTRDTRLADQMSVAQKRAQEDFDSTARGTFWRGVKSASRGATTVFGSIYSWINAGYRTGTEGLAQAARGFGVSSMAKGQTANIKLPEKEIPGALQQTVAGQVVIKSIADVKKGQFPKIDMGNGFFPSEETGVGHAARQNSLAAAKVAIRNSKGEVIGWQPRTAVGDAWSNILTLGHQESQAGAAISFAADVAASFMFDSGLARASDIKALRKLAEQERAAGALSKAAQTEARAAKLDDAATRAQEDLKAVRTQDTLVKKYDTESQTADLNLSKAAREGKAADAIKSSIGVRTATARLNEVRAYKEPVVKELASATETRKAMEEALKAPKVIERSENALTKTLKQLDEIRNDNSAAIAAGRAAMNSEEDIAALEATVKAMQDRITLAKQSASKFADNPITEETLQTAKQTEATLKARLKDATSAEKASIAQVAERELNATRAYRAREIAVKDTLKKTKSRQTLAEKLDNAQFGAKAAKAALADSIKNIANLDQTLERPEFAYQAIADFLTAGHGTRAVDALIEVTDWKAIWRKANGRIDHATAQALAAAKTPDDVVDILAPYLIKGEIQGGILKPGLISRMGEAATARTAFAAPTARKLMGVGARVQTRMLEHEKVAQLFVNFVDPAAKWVVKSSRAAQRSYQTKIKAGSIVNIHDREELLRATEDFGNAAKLPKEVLDKLIDGVANAQSSSVAGKIASIDLLNAVFAHYSEKIPAHMQDAFKSYTTAFKDSAEQMSSYWATRHANGAELRYMTLNGESVILPGPHMSSELLNSTVYFPPVSEFLKLTSKLGKYKTLAEGTRLADIAIGDFWKKIQLVRPAYIIRNIAEEQIRVAALGHISFFTNPGMALAMWMGREDGKATRRLLAGFDTFKHTIFDESFSTGDDATDILNEVAGHDLKNSYIKIMNADKAGAMDERAFKVLQFKSVGSVEFGHPRFFDGVANSLRMLNSDEMARVVAGFDPAYVKERVLTGAFRQDAVVDYFLSGPGRKELEAFLEALPEKSAAFFRTKEGLKSYLYVGKDAQTGADISMLARITEATGGNKSLFDLVANGKTLVGGAEYKIPTSADSAINSITNSKQMRAGKKALLEAQEEFAKKLKKTFSEAGNWSGAKMNVPSRNLAHLESKKEKGRYVQMFFDKATELERNSTFGPEFRQAYWDAINKIAKALDSNAKAQLLKVAEGSLTPLQKAGVQVGDKHPVWNAFRAAKGDGPLSIEDAHAYADTYARKQVENLFYNAQEKRLIFHQLRLVAPFASAWEDTVKRWSELAIENPMQVYKGVKALDWLTSPQSSSLYQLTDAQDYYDPNQGFFFTDPQSGQRQFFVPFAGTAMAALAKNVTGANYSGAPMAFSATPTSFNFAFGTGSILPGVGPGVTLPLSMLGTFKGNWIDSLPLGVQKWLFPFGRADFSSGLQSAILPGNWNKILGAGGAGSEASYANNFKPVMNYLASGGNYNLDDPEDQARLVADTDTFSRWESAMRGLVGLVSPMPLIQKGLAKDKDGDVTLQTAVFADFQKILNDNDGDYNKSWFDFLNLYGPSQAFAIISSSAGNGPSNWDSYNFVVSNPDVASKYPDVWGYVMPGGGLSTEMYQWNVAHDTKKRLTSSEILQKVNNQRYYAARDALMTKVDANLMDRKQYSSALQYLKDAMGGGPVVEFDSNKRGRILSQLQILVDDERFADIPSVSGLRDYMYLRDTALQTLNKKKFTGAANEQAARDWLAAQAETTIARNPDFQKMFYAFFANELEGK